MGEASNRSNKMRFNVTARVRVCGCGRRWPQSAQPADHSRTLVLLESGPVRSRFRFVSTGTRDSPTVGAPCTYPALTFTSGQFVQSIAAAPHYRIRLPVRRRDKAAARTPHALTLTCSFSAAETTYFPQADFPLPIRHHCEIATSNPSRPAHSCRSLRGLPEAERFALPRA